jgi:hypothetical protein
MKGLDANVGPVASGRMRRLADSVYVSDTLAQPPSTKGGWANFYIYSQLTA